MGEKINFIKRFFWLKQASICLHNIPKNAKRQNLGGKFSTFGRKKSLRIMISDFWELNEYNGVPLYFHKSDIIILNASLK